MLVMRSVLISFMLLGWVHASTQNSLLLTHKSTGKTKTITVRDTIKFTLRNDSILFAGVVQQVTDSSLVISGENINFKQFESIWKVRMSRYKLLIWGIPLNYVGMIWSGIGKFFIIVGIFNINTLFQPVTRADSYLIGGFTDMAIGYFLRFLSVAPLLIKDKHFDLINEWDMQAQK